MADGYAQATHNAAFVNLHPLQAWVTRWQHLYRIQESHAAGHYRGQQARSILPYDPFLFSGPGHRASKAVREWSCEPARAEDVPLAIARAYYTAMQPPAGRCWFRFRPMTGRSPASPSKRVS